MVDLKKGESFTFLGFDYRRVLSLQRKWRPYYAPKLKKRTALFERLREIFRQHVSWPVETVIAKINPVLRGWVNCWKTSLLEESRVGDRGTLGGTTIDVRKPL